MYNLATICFMCLTENKCLKTLYNNDIENDAARQIKYLLPEIMLSELKISVHMCCACHTALQNFHSFKTRCMDNYYRLKNYLNTVKPTPTNPIKEIPPLPPKENNNEKKAPAPEPEKNNDITMEIEDDPLLLLERREHINLIEDSMDMNIKEELFDSEESDEQDNCQPIQFIKCEMPDDEPTNSNLPNIPPIKDYECSICEEKFVRHRDFRDHMNKNHAESTDINSLKLLPEKSRKKYEAVYKTFMEWRSNKNIDSLSENVLLTYFLELSQKYVSSSLWAQYSMLRSTININNNVSIERYTKLRAFLKRKGQGYLGKKAKLFSPEEIKKFINEAPDNTYLAIKVAMIMGIMGQCHVRILHSLNIDNIEDLGTAMIVTVVPNTKTKIIRKFTITGHFYPICKKYADLRPSNLTTNSFFINYYNGKCTQQNIGINKFGGMGKQVAKYLKLPNPELYTGHSFRKSYAALILYTGGDINALRMPDTNRI